MMRERDYAYEALAEATDADMNANRGELNVALKTIREQAQIEDSFLLSVEIHEQAARYRQVMGPEVLLTPTALAKHWTRVRAVSLRPTGTNLTAKLPLAECPTCRDDRMVVVGTRRPVQSSWMEQRGIRPSEAGELEEVAPCPDCNAGADTKFRRYDGTPVVAPDPERVRELMRG